LRSVERRGSVFALLRFALLRFIAIELKPRPPQWRICKDATIFGPAKWQN
jgi:hypothetical protein